MVRQRVRIRFCKQGDLRLIGHLDLMRCLERLARRAGLPLAFSQGFHPKPRMSFPLALAVGIEGTDEVMELELAAECRADELLRRLECQAPPGLMIVSVETLPPESKKAQARSATYEAPIPPQHRAALAEKVRRLMASSSCLVPHRRRKTPCDVRPLVEELAVCEDVLRMRLRTGNQRGAGPREVLAALGMPDLEQQGSVLRRTAVEILLPKQKVIA